MSAPRAAILDRIRRGLKRGPLDAAAAAVLDARMDRRADDPLPPPLVPGRARVGGAVALDDFAARVAQAAGTVERVATAEDAVAEIARYLKAHNLPTTLDVADDPVTAALPWDAAPTLTASTGRRLDADTPVDAVAVTAAFRGIAETGTLMTLSGPDHPTTLNFVAETHIAVLPTDRIVGGYEEAWAALRAARGQDGTVSGGVLPRAVHWITGPSRTADIELKIQLGAHGPRRLHVVLVDRL